MRDQSESEKLIPLFKDKITTRKENPALALPIHHPEPFRCAYCKNRNLQAFSTVYGHGTSLARYTRGLWIQTGWARTVRQTELAKRCAPPQKQSHWLALFFIAVALAGFVVTGYVPQSIVGNSLPTFAIAGLLGVVLIARNIWWNRSRWPGLMDEWSRMFYCPRCGCVTRM